MPTRFEAGTGIMFDMPDRVGYGVIMSDSGSSIEIVPVQKLDSGVRCHDEGGAVYSRHKDNVKLKDCPPPFTFMCAFSERGCYVMASPDARLHMTYDEADAYGVSVLDDGVRISNRDMSEILDHPWRDEMEASVKRTSAMDRLTSFLSQPDDVEVNDDGLDGPGF